MNQRLKNNENDLISEENVGAFNDDAITLHQDTQTKIQDPSTRATKLEPRQQRQRKGRKKDTVYSPYRTFFYIQGFLSKIFYPLTSFLHSIR